MTSAKRAEAAPERAMGIEQRERQGLWNGFGTALTRAFEFALTPIVFGLLGAGLDHLLGTWPLFMILFGLFAVAGLAVRSYYSYAAEMAEHEQQLPGRARPDRVSNAS